MKKALLLGGGSLLGLELTHLLSQSYDLTVITSSTITLPNVNVIIVDWSKFGLKKLNTAIYHFIKNGDKIDLILFNQNSRQGPNIPNFFDPDDLNCLYKDWLMGYKSDCMIPYYVIHKLHKNLDSTSKIGWMFSSLINQYIDIDKTNHASYRGIKFTNYFLMNAFAHVHQSIFFGIDPGHITDENRKMKALEIIYYINHSGSEINNQVYSIENKNYWQPLMPLASSDPI